MGWICRIRDTAMQGLFILSVTLSPVSADLHAPAHGYGHAPEFYCRDTNNSIYAEVCVPAFTDKVTPITLAVKEVVDNDYCFDRVLTVCEETSTIVEREICTYVYEQETHPTLHHHPGHLRGQVRDHEGDCLWSCRLWLRSPRIRPGRTPGLSGGVPDPGL